LFNGPAAPPLPDPLLPLASPGSRVEPDPVLPSGPLPELDPLLPLPDVPPSRVESGDVLGWLPVPVGLHPPLTEQSVLGAVEDGSVESCAMAGADTGPATSAISKVVAASFILGS
jgi:hypothetical protein